MKTKGEEERKGSGDREHVKKVEGAFLIILSPPRPSFIPDFAGDGGGILSDGDGDGGACGAPGFFFVCKSSGEASSSFLH